MSGRWSPYLADLRITDPSSMVVTAPVPSVPVPSVTASVLCSMIRSSTMPSVSRVTASSPTLNVRYIWHSCPGVGSTYRHGRAEGPPGAEGRAGHEVRERIGAAQWPVVRDWSRTQKDLGHQPTGQSCSGRWQQRRIRWLKWLALCGCLRWGYFGIGSGTRPLWIDCERRGFYMCEVRGWAGENRMMFRARWNARFRETWGGELQYSVFSVLSVTSLRQGSQCSRQGQSTDVSSLSHLSVQCDIKPQP